MRKTALTLIGVSIVRNINAGCMHPMRVRQLQMVRSILYTDIHAATSPPGLLLVALLRYAVSRRFATRKAQSCYTP